MSASWKGVRESAAELPSRAGLLILLGGTLNIIIISFGLRDVLTLPFGIAVAFATGLVGVQYVLGTLVPFGFWVGVGRLAAYIFIVCVNLVLAVSGIIALGQPDVLGRQSFEEVVAAPRAQIVAVTDIMVNSETALSRLSAHSEQRASEEANNGGSCGPTDGGRGPVFRVRDNDKNVFAAFATQSRNRADQMRGIRTSLDSAISGYSAGRHAAVARQIDGLVDQARQLAADPGIGQMRAALEARRAGEATTTPDPLTGVAVRCPDPELARALTGVLQVAPPAVPPIQSLPSEPSHQAAAVAYLSAIGGLINGRTVGLQMWIVATLISFFPDLILILGITQARAVRKARLGVVGRMAGQIDPDRPGIDTVLDAAESLSVSEKYSLFQPHHSSRDSLLGRTDFLCIPVSNQRAYYAALTLVGAKAGKYIGYGPAHALPKGAMPRPNYVGDCHFFVFRGKAWTRFLVELMKLAHLEQAASSGDDQYDLWEEAAE